MLYLWVGSAQVFPNQTYNKNGWLRVLPLLRREVLSHTGIGADCSHVESRHISSSINLTFFPSSVKAHLTEPLAVLLEAASLWYMTLSDSSYFWEAPTNSSAHVNLTGCCCCCCRGKQTMIWDTWLPQSILYPSACSLCLLCAPFHSRIVSLPFCGMSAAYPEISSTFSYQTFAHIYCFNIQRYWSATGLDGKSSQNHK